jgi:hypothetical protein
MAPDWDSREVNDAIADGMKDRLDHEPDVYVSAATMDALKRLVKLCTKRFRGNVADAASSAVMGILNG